MEGLDLNLDDVLDTKLFDPVDKLTSMDHSMAV